MFIYSVRASTVKFFGFILLTVMLLFGAAIVSNDNTALAASAGATVDYSGMKENSDRVSFIEQFGIDVDDEPTDEKSFKMPDNFDRVIVGYNQLQKKQGLDLSKYARKRVTRYTYKVNNYDSDSEVYANLFVYRGKIVACDISSADPEGFVVPLTLVEKSNLK